MNTNKKFQIIVMTIGLLLGGIISCEDNLTDETFSVIDENALTKPAHGEQAVRGVYAALRDNGGYGYYAGFYYWLNEYQADVVTASTVSKQGEQLDQLTYDASNSIINNVWLSIFRLIARANAADELISKIDYVENGSTAQLKNQHLAEVRFLRALAYYDATSLWGDVPLFNKTSSSFSEADENPVLQSQTAVEQNMLTDLEFAEANLPNAFGPDESGRATSGAAKSMLVRLYMRQGGWQLAVDKAQEVIDQGIYDLRSVGEGGLKGLFESSNRNDNEFIFVLKSSNETSAYGVTSNSFGINSTPWDLNRGWGNLPIHLQFYTQFESGDNRRDLLTGIYSSLYGQVISVPEEFGGLGGTAPDTVLATYIYNLKYPHVNNYNYSGFNNVPILRYADILMYKAEALNELTGPSQQSIDLINSIRVRSSAEPIQLTDLTSKDAMRDFIFAERNREFFMEGKRREDLFRWGSSATNGSNPLLKFKEMVLPRLNDPSTYSDNINYFFYPYPQNEIDSNSSLESSVNTGRVRM
jgi:starch-binding outer membrane protein, SusD/RagB family